MKEDNAVYDLYIYQCGVMIKQHKGLDYWQAQEIYYQYDPFTNAGVDIYRNGVRMKFGEALRKMNDPSRFVKLY